LLCAPTPDYPQRCMPSPARRYRLCTLSRQVGRGFCVIKFRLKKDSVHSCGMYCVRAALVWCPSLAEFGGAFCSYLIYSLHFDIKAVFIYIQIIL